jgi:hypothetical protein
MGDGVGVRGWRGITDGGSVEISAGGLAGSGVESPFSTAQAWAVKTMIPRKKKGFENFIFMFPAMTYVTTGFSEKWQKTEALRSGLLAG